MKIQELTGWLTAARVDYKEQYRKAVEERKNAMKELDANFKQGTDFYKARKTEILETFNKRIAELRVNAYNIVAPYFEELKAYEVAKVHSVDKVTLEKLNALSNVPMTVEEIKVLNEKFVKKSDYWGSRTLATIAEKNGINPEEIGIEPTLDTKLYILNSLSAQLDKMLLEWDCENQYNAEADAQLGTNTLRNAELMYTNGVVEHNNKKIVDRAYWKIRAAGSQIEKAMIINNVLRNMSEDNREALMCKLTLENNISDATIQMSGHGDLFAEWAQGKAAEYASAIEAVEKIKNIKETDTIKMHIADNTNNQFFGKLLDKEANNNPVLRNAMQGETTE